MVPVEILEEFVRLWDMNEIQPHYMADPAKIENVIAEARRWAKNIRGIAAMATGHD